MFKPEVSIIIPCLNCASSLEKCLDSIRANRTMRHYEIIVVDAGSTDRTLEIAGWYTDKIFIGKPHTINRNIGIEKAAGQIICFTDSDCIVPKNWIDNLWEGLTQLHKDDKKIVGVGGGNAPLLENPTLIEQAIAKAMRSPLVSFKTRNTAVYHTIREVAHNPPMNSAYFKWVLDEIGGFKEKQGYPEDLDLDARITSRGYKLYYIPGADVLHKHKSTLESFIRQMRDFGSKRWRVNRQQRHIARFYHYGPAFLCLMLLSPLFFIPLTMALANAFWVSLKDRAFKLFFPVVKLTIDFYLYYGAGEIKAVMESIK